MYPLFAQLKIPAVPPVPKVPKLPAVPKFPGSSAGPASPAAPGTPAAAAPPSGKGPSGLEKFETSVSQSSAFQWLQNNWGTVLLVVLGIALIVTLIIVIRRRRSAVEGDEEAETVVKQQALGFKTAWRQFVRQLPRRYRASIHLFHPYLVFGPDGSGKTALIERCVDWRAQEFQYHPSHTKNPNLQIYHGPSQVVQEFAGSVLTDPSPRVGRQLAGLWKIHRRSSPPKLLYVMSVDALVSEPIERIVRDVQMVRGKLNLLSSTIGKPVEVSLALTHMDHCIGYREFNEGFEGRGYRFQLDLEADATPEQLVEQMRRSESNLPQLMKNLSPVDYVKAAAFIDESPTFLNRISVMVSTLAKPDPTNYDPVLGRLYLTSSTDSGERACNPFASELSAKEVKRRDPYRKHRWLAAAITVFGLMYLAAGYVYERQTVQGAEKILRSTMESGTTGFDYNVQERFYNYLAERRNSLLSKVLPDFGDNHDFFVERAIKDGYVERFEGKLRAVIRNLRDSTDGQDLEKYLFLSAMAASTVDNEMGKLVMNNAAAWEEVTWLSKYLIRDYVQHRDNTKVIAPVLTPVKSGTAVEELLGTRVVQVWDPFLAGVYDASKQEIITLEQLRTLQAQAMEILQEVDGLNQHSLAVEIIRIMKDMGVSVGPQWDKELRHRAISQNGPLVRLLELVENAEMDVPKYQDMTLQQIVDFIAERGGRDIKGENYAILTPERSYVVDGVAWANLLKRSTLVTTMNGYRSRAWVANSWKQILFGDISAFPKKQLNARDGDDPFFQGQAEVLGYYALAAFEERVLPQIRLLPATLKALPVPPNVNQNFDLFVRDTLATYAADYERVYVQFYDAHDVRQFSRQILPYVAQQLSSPGSPLLVLLKQIRDSTNFPAADGNPYLKPFEAIANRFAEVRAVVGKAATASPNWAAYANIVAGLAERLDNSKPYAPKKGDQYVALKADLSPYAREALDFLLQVPQSAFDQLETWLRTAKLRRKWQRPFRGFFNRILDLGVEDLQDTLTARWADDYEQFVLPLTTRFPFDPTATEIAPAALLSDAISPNGAFWKSFRNYIAPLCVEVDGRWALRTTKGAQINFPPEMIGIVNRLAQLRDALWDKKGVPKPIALKLRPLPLPRGKTDLRAVISNLQVGKSIVFSFNQEPSWQTVDLEWWKSSSARISVGYAKYGRVQKEYAGLGVSSERWGFYRLLQQAKRRAPDQQVWFWTVRNQNPTIPITSVEYEFAVDPWEALRIQPSSTKGK